MIKKTSILIILLQLFIHQLLLAQCCNEITYKPDPKVHKQFDYFDFSTADRSKKLENSLLPDGNMTVYMSYWSDWEKSNHDRVFQAVQKGLSLLKDSITDPLSQYVITIALSPDAPEPLFRFKKRAPKTTDFVEINNEVLSVKHNMDSIIVADYTYNVPKSKGGSLYPVLYVFTLKDLSRLDLGPEWRQSFDSLNTIREKGLGWQNLRSRVMLFGGVGIGVAMNGTAYPALDGGLYLNAGHGGVVGTTNYIGYGGSVGYAGFNGNRGLYLFHGLEFGFLSGEQMTAQKVAVRIGAAHIRTFKLRNGFVVPVNDTTRSAAYLGITIPVGRTVSFTFDFASNFRFTKDNHVGYFGGKVNFYFKLL
ncbi:MAG: hypothetical protein BGO31_05785 [Bacteroidetes bacterium 43-16]|nr:MAG: hypothetical protein BGO31_05785 [Bacteroidetes bacterium 43-16]